MNKEDIINGEAMKAVTGATDKDVQKRVLEAANIPYWDDARGRPVTHRDNLPTFKKPQIATAKKTTLRLANAS